MNATVKTQDEKTGTVVYDLTEWGQGTKSVTPVSDAEFQRQVSEARPVSEWASSIRALYDAQNVVRYGNPDRQDATKPRMQLLCWLANHPQYAYTRAHLEALQQVLVSEDNLSNDVIQIVNKTDQGGMLRFAFRWNGSRWYCLPAAVFDDTRLSARKMQVTDFDKKVALLRKKYHAWANEETYERGHKDPNLPGTDDNIVAQPHSLNGGWRDQYIFDDNGLPKCHNPRFLIDHPENIGKYYTKDQARELAAAFASFASS